MQIESVSSGLLILDPTAIQTIINPIILSISEIKTEVLLEEVISFSSLYPNLRGKTQYTGSTKSLTTSSIIKTFPAEVSLEKTVRVSYYLEQSFSLISHSTSWLCRGLHLYDFFLSYITYGGPQSIYILSMETICLLQSFLELAMDFFQKKVSHHGVFFLLIELYLLFSSYSYHEECQHLSTSDLLEQQSLKFISVFALFK